MKLLRHLVGIVGFLLLLSVTSFAQNLTDGGVNVAPSSGGGGGGGGLAVVNGTTNEITATTVGTTVTLSIPTTFDAPGTINAVTSVSSGTPPAVTGSYTGGIFAGGEGTCPNPLTGSDILCANSSAHQWQVSNNGGSFADIGSGGSSLTLDPTLTTADGVTGLSVTPEQFGAIGNGIWYQNGAMSASGTTLTDTTNSPFVSGDVGYLICVDNTNTTTDQLGDHVGTCGTITAFTSSSAVTVSFTNNGGSLSNVPYVFGANDSTAMANAFANASVLGAETLWLGDKTYMVNTALAMPVNGTLRIQGLGDMWDQISYTACGYVGSFLGTGSPICNPFFSKRGSIIWWAKEGSDASPLSGNGITFSPPGGGVGSNTNVGGYTFDTIDGVMLRAGIGLHWDGGSSTSDGVRFQSWQNAKITNSQIVDWGGDALDVFVSLANAASSNGFLTFDSDMLYASGRGFGTGPASLSGGPGASFNQNLTFEDDQFMTNLDDGFVIQQPVHSMYITDSVFQDNDVAQSTSFGEINFLGNCYACNLTSNYIEMDEPNTKGIIVVPATGSIQGPDLYDNFGTTNGGVGSDAALYINGGANMVIEGNNFSNPTTITGTGLESSAVIANQGTNLTGAYAWYGSGGSSVFNIGQTGQFQPVPIAEGSLPGTCTQGNVIGVSGASSTVGTCTSGSANTLAVCQSGNVWLCL